MKSTSLCSFFALFILQILLRCMSSKMFTTELKNSEKIHNKLDGVLFSGGGRETESSKRKYDRKSKSSKSHGLLSYGGRGAKSMMKFTRGAIKKAFDAITLKKVFLKEIVGKWRIYQDIEIRHGVFVSCPASIELFENRTLISHFNGSAFVTSFKFIDRSWPRPCLIQFEAAIFKSPLDHEPIRFYYKGYFKKSMMNNKIILIRGKVYKVKKNM